MHILQFENLENPYFRIWKIIKFFECSNDLKKIKQNKFENENIE